MYKSVEIKFHVAYTSFILLKYQSLRALALQNYVLQLRAFSQIYFFNLFPLGYISMPLEVLLGAHEIYLA